MLFVRDNALSRLHNLPEGIEGLCIHDTDLESIDVPLPLTLRMLFVLNNPALKRLSPLPPGLVTLNCGGCVQLDSLPELPRTLRTLICRNTALTRLPPLPSGLRFLQCRWTNISELPELPEEIEWLAIPTVPHEKGEQMDSYIARVRDMINQKRVRARTQIFFEELMSAAWHPRRVQTWLNQTGFAMIDS